MFGSLVWKIVALNAVIALLGDSFESVLESKFAFQNMDRAKLILENMVLMDEDKVKNIEQKTTWVFRLMPESLINKEDTQWQGRIKAIGSLIKAGTAQVETVLLNNTKSSDTMMDDKLRDVKNVVVKKMTERLDEVQLLMQGTLTQLDHDLDENVKGGTALVEERLGELERNLSKLEQNLETRLVGSTNAKDVQSTEDKLGLLEVKLDNLTNLVNQLLKANPEPNSESELKIPRRTKLGNRAVSFRHQSS